MQPNNPYEQNQVGYPQQQPVSNQPTQYMQPNTPAPTYAQPQQVPVAPQQYQQQVAYQQYAPANYATTSTPSFAIIALIILQVLFTIFSLINMVNLFSDIDGLERLQILLSVLFFVTTVGYAFLLFKIYLRRYWALMVYVGAIALSTTFELRDVVAFTNIEWSYVISLLFSVTLLGLSIFLATAKKALFNQQS